MGRFCQLDPKPTDFESPYAAMGNDPVLRMDVLGDTSEPGMMDRKLRTSILKNSYSTVEAGIMNGCIDVAENVFNFITRDAWKASTWKNMGSFVEQGALSMSTVPLAPTPMIDAKVDEFMSNVVNGDTYSRTKYFTEFGLNFAIGYAVGKAVGAVADLKFSLKSTLPLKGAKLGDVTTPTGAQYSVAFETKLPSNLYPGGTYRAHFQAANTSLSNAMASDATFSNSISKLGISIPLSETGNILGKSPANWVWHHNVNVGVMQLVPKIQHPSIPGGIFWNTMHPGGRGGMSIWNK